MKHLLFMGVTTRTAMAVLVFSWRGVQQQLGGKT